MTARNDKIPGDSAEPYNIFRDSPLRYAGYANEVGESFRYQFPRLVAPTYVVAFGYCLADASSTGYDQWISSTNQKSQGSSEQQADAEATRIHNTIRGTADTLLWQSLASVAIPGACINLLVKVCRTAVRRSPVVLPALAVEWLPTATGLLSVPFIVSPIDHSVDYMLDNTTRKWWKPMN